MKPKFTHLHVHSHYSLLDGLPKIPDLIKQTKELGMDSVGLTDHGVLYGAVEFFKEAKKQGVKPIIGQELYVTPGSMHQKRPKVDDVRYHLTVLVKNEAGYKNLVALTTKAHLDGFYYRPRVDKDLLREHSEGLVCLSGCINGELSRTIRTGNTKKAEEVISEYQEIFKKENYFLEIWDHPEVENSENVKNEIVKLAKKTNIPLVATHDVHYIRSDDDEAQDILVAVQTGRTVNEEERMSMRGEDFSLLSPDKMAEKFKDVPEAIENTQKVVDMCNFEFVLGETKLPSFDVPDKKTPDEHLKELSYMGAKKRFGEKLSAEVTERLDYELGIIKKIGFAEYFLIVQDFVRWAKEQKIVVGPGRGSVAGSLVAYALGITTIDPLKYGLLFERFLNPERAAMPDIDLDFADTRRDEVIQYVREKYGEDHVAQIITFGTMAARAAIRDTGRALGLPYDFCDKTAKLIPFGFNLKKSLDQVAEFKQLYDTNKDAKKLIDQAIKLEGVARHASTHACGVVITRDPLTETIPLQKASRGDETVVTQYEMHAIEDLGLLKMDFLGLKNLTIIEEALKEIKRNKGVDIDIEEIPHEDEKTFKLLQKGQTTGVFQLESGGMKRYLKQLKPTEIDDIIAMAALYRPGPMELIPSYIKRKHGEEPVSYIHPVMEDILEPTYGIIVYQEQVMEMATQLAGLTRGEGYILIKAVGKKIKKLLDKQKDLFIDGCKKNKVAEDIARKAWSLIEPFARYGFNKSHSTCYAMIAYQTAYLKAHYPIEFMNALLNADSGDVERIAFLSEEATGFGIEVLPPDVNESGVGFRVTGKDKIRFGISAIKNVGGGVAESVVREREANGQFAGIEDFLSRVTLKDINKKSIESLARAGAFDSMEERGKLLENIDSLLSFAKESQKAKEAGQESIFDVGEVPSPTAKIRLTDTEPASKKQRLAWEKELLGLYISDHPLSDMKETLNKNTKKIRDLSPTRRMVSVGGILTSLKKITTKNGQPMIFAQLEDLSGKVEVVVFPSALQKNQELWEEDKIVLVRGKVQERDSALKVICEEAQILTA